MEGDQAGDRNLSKFFNRVSGIDSEGPKSCCIQSGWDVNQEQIMEGPFHCPECKRPVALVI
jgi:hypothetical protein